MYCVSLNVPASLLPPLSHCAAVLQAKDLKLKGIGKDSHCLQCIHTLCFEAAHWYTCAGFSVHPYICTYVRMYVCMHMYCQIPLRMRSVTSYVDWFVTVGMQSIRPCSWDLICWETCNIAYNYVCRPTYCTYGQLTASSKMSDMCTKNGVIELSLW